jgi:hypothetical protein
MNDQITSERPKRAWAKICQVHEKYLIAKTRDGENVWVNRAFGDMPIASSGDFIAFYAELMRPPNGGPPPTTICKYFAVSPRLEAKKWTPEALHAAEVVQEIAEQELKWGTNADRVFRHGKETANAGYTSTRITCSEKSDAQ